MLPRKKENNREEYTLLELATGIRQTMELAFPDSCWVRAEMSDVRVNNSSGHCYLEFLEKSADGRQLLAKVRGTIWARTYRMIKPYFEEETGQAFTSGLKVLVNVSVEFHEIYGLSLTVLDIDPAYTLGDMIRKRMEIVKRLQEEGVFSLNKELTFPTLPLRIALISSPTAAGYEDFMDQLRGNKARYPFLTKLFPAIMQGERTEESVIAALDRIYEMQELFDVVVIIRGGGSTSDLNSFDSYLLAANCAQFPLPILTGIGHERDDTVVDMIAHKRLKTPTAVAEFLIGKMDANAEELSELEQSIVFLASDKLTEQKHFLKLTVSRFPSVVSNRIERNRTVLQSICGKLPAISSGTLLRSNSLLQNITNKMPATATALLQQHHTILNNLSGKLENRSKQLLTERKRSLELTEQFVRMASPEYILKRGYSLTMKEGKIVKRAADVSVGDRLAVRFSDGEAGGTVDIISFPEEKSK